MKERPLTDQLPPGCPAKWRFLSTWRLGVVPPVSRRRSPASSSSVCPAGRGGPAARGGRQQHPRRGKLRSRHHQLVHQRPRPGHTRERDPLHHHPDPLLRWAQITHKHTKSLHAKMSHSWSMAFFFKAKVSKVFQAFYGNPNVDTHCSQRASPHLFPPSQY